MAKRKNRRTVASGKATGKKVRANKKYKDTVFRMLFSDRNNLLSLYNAISGTKYEDPNELEIVTLENAIYMGMKNDLAFIVDTNLFLYEHQSTYNPNMPLRDLLYISSEYQKLVDHRSLYSSTLSEAYENLSGEPNLELRVLTLNINEGHNRELMEQCLILREYAQYVAKVRNYTKEMELDEAVEHAVNECIHEGILAEFLKKNRAEVIAMSIFEYDKEEEEKKLRKAEFEAGYNSGRQDGIDIGIRAMLDSGKHSLEEIAEVFHVSVDEVERINDK